jgi:hypothetical protein
VKDLGHRQKAASSRKVVEKEKVADRKMVARLGEEKNKKVKKVGPDELEVEVELSQAGAKARSHRRSLCAIRLSRYQPNQTKPNQTKRGELEYPLPSPAVLQLDVPKLHVK